MAKKLAFVCNFGEKPMKDSKSRLAELQLQLKIEQWRAAAEMLRCVGLFLWLTLQ